MCSVEKQLGIKLRSIKNLRTELDSYLKEKQDLDRKITNLARGEGEPHELRQTQDFLEESIAVIGATTLRLNKSIDDLAAFLRNSDSELSEELLKSAETELEAAQQFVV